MPDTEAAAYHRSGHRPKPDCRACPSVAVPQCQFCDSSLDRTSRRRVFDDNTTQAAADGFSNRSRREVPARICAVRLPPWLLADGASGVILPATTASWLTGYIPDLPTPLDDADRIDVRALERLCERQISAGVSALVVCETAGEAMTRSLAERDTVIRATVEIARGRARIIAGAGSNSTNRAIELTRHAKAAGADAVLSVVPYYN